MKNDPDLVSFFKNEHHALLTIFEKEFKKAQGSKNWKSLFSFCWTQFEENHHEKEERFIFEAVRKNERIKSGGPLCTYFFDNHRSNPSLRRAMETVQKQAELSMEPIWTPQMKDIREKNIPLAIPGEDHEAGRLLLRGIEHLFTLEQTENIQNKIEILFKTYIEIQKTHFDREENCFFRMCSDLIPSEKWHQIYSDMCESYNEIRDSI